MGKIFLIDDTFKKINLEKEKIDEIILVGSYSIQKKLKNHFKNYSNFTKFKY